MSTYLTLAHHACLIVAVRRGTERSSELSASRTDTSSLRQILLPLRTSDLDLLLLTTTAELVGLESPLSLEVGPTVSRDVAFRHVEILLI